MEEGIAPGAMLHGYFEETSAEIPCLTAGCLAGKRQEGPVLSPVLWKAQKVCIFTLFNGEQGYKMVQNKHCAPH